LGIYVRPSSSAEEGAGWLQHPQLALWDSKGLKSEPTTTSVGQRHLFRMGTCHAPTVGGAGCFKPPSLVRRESGWPKTGPNTIPAGPGGYSQLECGARSAQHRRSQPAFIMIMIMKLVSVRHASTVGGAGWYQHSQLILRGQIIA
jgi:hypothetical protein